MHAEWLGVPWRFQGLTGRLRAGKVACAKKFGLLPAYQRATGVSGRGNGSTELNGRVAVARFQ